MARSLTEGNDVVRNRVDYSGAVTHGDPVSATTVIGVLVLPTGIASGERCLPD